MILYFTGTGNSKYAADVLADVLSDDVISLGEVIKNHRPLAFRSEKPFVIVAPIYAWRLPIKIEELIENAEFMGNNNIYFIVTMGSESGSCDKYCEKICKNKKLNFMGLFGVSMPSNYIVSDKMPTPDEANEKLRTATPLIKEVGAKIKNNERIEKTDKTPASGLKSGLVNKFFNKFAVTSDGYVCSEKCTSCSKCALVCPTNNILLQGGKPTFGGDCMSCYACINNCPVSAIDIKGKSEDKGRYLCPEYKAQ